jgi:hypothetical protein
MLGDAQVLFAAAGALLASLGLSVAEGDLKR